MNNNEFNILIAGMLDEKKTSSNIASSIKSIEKQLDNIHISLNLKDIETSFKAMMREVVKEASKTKVYDSELTKNEISKSIKDFKDLEKEINSIQEKGFKKGKTSTSFIDIGEGNKLKKIVTEYNDELSNTIKFTENINTSTGELVSIEKAITDNVKKRSDEISKLSNKIGEMNEKSQLKVEKQDRKDEIAQAKAINKALEDEYDAQVKLEKQVREVNLAKREAEASIRKISKSNDNYDVAEMARLTEVLKNIDAEASDASLQIRELKSEIKMFDATSREASITTNSFNDSLKRFAAFWGVSEVIQLTERAIRSMSDSVMELDRSILEVQKTASIPDMDKFIKQSYESADSLKILGTSFIDGVGEASRMGYDLDESFDMSNIANKMVIVGDGISNVNTAMGVLQSTLAIFSKNGYVAEDVLNLLNQTANNTGVSFGELADMLSVNANLGIGGNSLESIIAMESALFEVNRSAEKTSTAINMINQTLQGVNIETGEQSLELISKIGDKLEALTGVSVFDEFDNMKASTKIIEEIGMVWDDLDISIQNATASLVGQNRHAKSFTAIMSNMDTYYKSLDESSRSANSAQTELNAYLESTTGKVEAMKGAIQELFITSLSGELVGNLAEITTNVIKLITECGGLHSVIIPIIGIMATFKSQSISKYVLDIGTSFKTWKSVLLDSAKAMTTVGTATNTAKVATIGFGTALNAAIPIIGIAVTAISLLVGEMSRQKAKAEEIKQANLEMAKSVSKETDAIKGIKDAYEKANSMTDGTKEKKDELLRIQNLLSESYGIEASNIDIVNGKYDEQIGKLDKLISKKNENAKIILNQNVDDTKKELEETINTKWMSNSSFGLDINGMRNAFKEVEKMYGDMFKSVVTDSPNGPDIFKVKIDTKDAETYSKILGDVISQMQRFGVNNNDVFNELYTLWQGVNESIENSSQAKKEALKAEAENVLITAKQKAGIVELTSATKEQYEAMRSDIISTYGGTLEKAAENSDVLSNSLSMLDNMFPQFSSNIDDSNDKIVGVSSSFIDLTSQFEGAIGKTDILSQAMDELSDTNNLSEDSLKSLASKYPELLEYMSTQEGLEAAIRSIQLSEYLDAESESIEFLNGCINSLNQNQTLTSDQIEKLVTLYPELSDCVDIVNGIYTISVDKLKELKDQSYNTASQRIADENSVTQAVVDQAKQRIDAYQTEIEFQKKLLLARSSVDSFGSGIIGENRNAMSAPGTDSNIAQIEDKIELEQKNLQSLINTLDKIEKEEIVLGAKASTGNTKAGSGIKPTKSASDKKIKEAFDRRLKLILSQADELNRTIDLTQQQLEMAELKGNEETANKLKQQLINQQKEKRDILHAQAEELRKLLAATTDVEQKATINSEIMKLQDEYHASKMNQYELEKKMIEELKQAELDRINDALDSKNELLDRQMDIMEISRIGMDENSSEYADSIIEELGIVSQRQSALLDSINDLKEQGYKQTDEEIDSLIDKWYDYEKQRLNMIKSQKDKEIKLQNDINSKKESLEKEIQDTLVKIMTDGVNKRKKELDKELDKYNNAIDDVMKSMDREDSTKSFEEDQLEITNSILDTEAEISKYKQAAKDGDVEAQLKVKELEKKLAEERKRLVDLQYNREKELRKDALNDSKDKAQEDTDNKKEELDEQLENEITKLESSKNLLDLTTTDMMGILDNFFAGCEISGESYYDSLDKISEKIKEIGDMSSQLDNMQNSNSNLGQTTNKPNSKPEDDFIDRNKSTIDKMKENSSKWKKTSDQTERDRLSEANQELGDRIGAYRDDDTGVWYTNKDKKIKLYKKGGVADYTGLAMLHGTKSEPERILSATQTKAFDELVNIQMPKFNNIFKSIKTPSSESDGEQQIIIDTLIRVDGNVDKGALPGLKEIANYTIKELENKIRRSGGFKK